jgi:hypothetical protein
MWRSILADNDLSEHELVLLRQAVRVADVCDDLQAVVDLEGPLTSNRLGERKAHPALIELRAQRLLLARLIVALRVPLGDEEDQGLPPGRLQRRGLRGVYAGGAA